MKINLIVNPIIPSPFRILSSLKEHYETRICITFNGFSLSLILVDLFDEGTLVGNSEKERERQREKGCNDYRR